MDAVGYCANCATWPINVTPIRRDKYGHVCKPDGWCWTCMAFTLTALEPEAGEWVDTGKTAAALGKDANKAKAKLAGSRINGPGWPEKQVPLNERFVPRRWKRTELKTVGETPNGDRIVFPTTAKLSSEESEVPF